MKLIKSISIIFTSFYLPFSFFVQNTQSIHNVINDAFKVNVVRQRVEHRSGKVTRRFCFFYIINMVRMCFKVLLRYGSLFVFIRNVHSQERVLSLSVVFLHDVSREDGLASLRESVVAFGSQVNLLSDLLLRVGRGLVAHGRQLQRVHS